MLSGYLCIYKTKMNYKRIMDIWGLLFFYSVLFLLISYPLYNITNKDIYKSVLPLTSRVDWFTTSYFGLFMIMPFINTLFIVDIILQRTPFTQESTMNSWIRFRIKIFCAPYWKRFKHRVRHIK